MGQRNFFLKKYFPLVEAWAILCGLFGFLFILARANFPTPHIKSVFILSYSGYVFAGAVIASLLHGGFRLLGINLEHRDAFVINSFVLDGHIDQNISNQNLNELFCQLKKESSTGFKKATVYASLVVFASSLTMYAIGASLANTAVILTGGFISVAILGLFPVFVGEMFFAGFLRECRKLLRERGLDIDEEIQLFTLKNRFYYFIFLFALISGIILSFITNFSYSVLAIFATGLIMVIIIARALFFSIFSVFQEIRDFADDLAQGKRTEYFAGASYREVLDLSNDLTKSAKEIYQARQKEKIARQELEKRKKELEQSNRELEQSKQELKQRAEELEKFYKLTVGRELRMIELKKEIADLAEKLKQEQSKL